ncbi:unnamed protein product, partial [Polarella glacialis]
CSTMEPWERWALGISLALLNVALSATGFTLQRKAHLRAAEEQRVDPEHATMACCPMWQ